MCSHKSHDPECVTRVYTSGFTQIAHFMQKTSSCGSFLNWKAPYVKGNHSVGGHLHFGSHLGCTSSVPFMPRILCKPSTCERGTRRMGTNMFDESTGIMLELGVVHHWGLGTSGFGKVKIKRHTSLIEDVLLRPCCSEPSCPTHRLCPSYLCYVHMVAGQTKRFIFAVRELCFGDITCMDMGHKYRPLLNKFSGIQLMTNV